jgi:arsenate reductase
MSSRTEFHGEKLKVLFLCTGIRAGARWPRGGLGSLKGDSIEAWSAGIETHWLNPIAVRVKAEAGVDISGHRSKSARIL